MSNTRTGSTNNEYLKRIIFPIVIFLFSIAGLYFLIIRGIIGEASFTALVILADFTALIVGFSNKIAHLKIFQFEATFREIKETEAAIKELAAYIIDVIEPFSQSAITDENFNENRFTDALTKLKKLVR